MVQFVHDGYFLTERECVHFMRQLCDGIEFMHEQNILHLDLKPENILCITPNSNEIKIIDFGLARQFDPSTSTKVLFGTPEFVAPEVINYDQIGYATDMWSVGVICYILVSGLSPFLGDNEPETLANVTMATWDFEDEAFDEISDDAKEFIGGLLVKSMRKRMSVKDSLLHTWMSQDVKYMRAKRLSTAKHKRFMARRKWQKTGHAIRALGRMASLQKALCVSRQNSTSNGSTTSSTRSRQSSLASDISVTSSRASRNSYQTSESQEEIITPPSPSLSNIIDNNQSRSRRAPVRADTNDDTFESNSTTTTIISTTTTTSRNKVQADLNSNDIQFDKNSSNRITSSITNGYSSKTRRAVANTNVHHEPEVVDNLTSPEPETDTTSPEMMSQDESEDNSTTDDVSDDVNIVSTPDNVNVAASADELQTDEHLDDDAEPSETSTATSQPPVHDSSTEEEQEQEEEHDSDVAEAADQSADDDDELAEGFPAFLAKLADFKAYEGDSARFDAQVSGVPEPDIQWLKNGNPIVVNRRKFVMDYAEKGKCSLIVKYCDEDDEASYSCRAINDKGQVTCQAQLTVKTFSRR